VAPRQGLPLDTALMAHSGVLHPATGPARPDPLMVHMVWHVLAGLAGSPLLPGRLRPHKRPPSEGPQGLVASQAAGDWEAVTRISGPTVGWPRKRRHRDPSHRSHIPGPVRGRWYYACRHCLHRLAAIYQALFTSIPLRGGNHARMPTGGADPAQPTCTPRPPPVAPLSFPALTWRPSRALRQLTGEKRITPWSRAWFRRHVAAWAFPQ